MYNDMASQSGCCLPIIYQPFDGSKKLHWKDRGSAFDFVFSTNGEGRRLLDFGPGDGWPSLIVAPLAEMVFGVDGSARRVQVCAENARRLGIANADFMYVEPGKPLPFKDGSFDGVMAASSVEQTPNPKATLQEFYRILRPGGRLRMGYENLSFYQSDREREAELSKIDDARCALTLYDRHIDTGRAVMYRIIFSLPYDKLKNFLSLSENVPIFDFITVQLLEKFKPVVSEARLCSLTHASGPIYIEWLKEAGFKEAMPTQGGDWFAGQVYDQYSEKDRPLDINAVDYILRPLIKIIVDMPAPFGGPGAWDPMITAVK